MIENENVLYPHFHESIRSAEASNNITETVEHMKYELVPEGGRGYEVRTIPFPFPAETAIIIISWIE